MNLVCSNSSGPNFNRPKMRSLLWSFVIAIICSEVVVVVDGEGTYIFYSS